MALHLVYGGTFDPIHNGHLAIACAARDALACTVHLMPAGDPPHRAPPGADGATRAAMVALAIEGVPGLVLDRRELERVGRSYTVDTLAELRSELGASTPLAWLVGADSLLSLTSWHRWEHLLGLAHFIVAERPGIPLRDAVDGALGEALQGRWTDDVQRLFASAAGSVLRLQQPLRSESASEVRARIAAGGAWRALLPPPVADYVATHQLYARPQA